MKLNNGVEVPNLGFGTWQADEGEDAYNAVLEALKTGYRHIDTASIYGNEKSVGRAIKDSNINRKDLFITTKLWNNDRGYEETIEAFNLSLKKLDLDYVDLYLIHWPNPFKYRNCWQKANADSWKAMEDLYKAGKIRAIGVSNFLIHHLDELMKTAQIKPMVNQIRLFPGLRQDKVIEYCRDRNILIEAYSPMGTGKIFESEEVKKIAKKNGKTMAQICIRYSMQKGYIPLPKSITLSRIRENFQVFDFEIAEEDIAVLDKMPNYCGALKDIDNITY